MRQGLVTPRSDNNTLFSSWVAAVVSCAELRREFMVEIAESCLLGVHLEFADSGVTAPDT